MYARSHRRPPSITGCLCRRTCQWHVIGTSPITLWIGNHAGPPLHLTPQPQRPPRPGQGQPPAPRQAEFVICDQTIEAKMRRLKSFGERIVSRDPDRQTAEVHTRIALMNRFSAFGQAEIMRAA